MAIRKAIPEDQEGIKSLLDQLEYPGTEKFLATNIKRSTERPDEALLVFEEDDEPYLYNHKILAFISLHFIPQITLEGYFARISYYSVDQDARSGGLAGNWKRIVI